MTLIRQCPEDSGRKSEKALHQDSEGGKIKIVRQLCEKQYIKKITNKKADKLVIFSLDRYVTMPASCIGGDGAVPSPFK